MKTILMLATAALFVVSCATDPEYEARKAADGRVVVTGSHLPKKYWPEEVRVVPREALERTTDMQGGGLNEQGLKAK